MWKSLRESTRMKAVEPVERVVRTMAALMRESTRMKAVEEPVERVVRTMAALMRDPMRMKAIEVSLQRQGREEPVEQVVKTMAALMWLKGLISLPTLMKVSKSPYRKRAENQIQPGDHVAAWLQSETEL